MYRSVFTSFFRWFELTRRVLCQLIKVADHVPHFYNWLLLAEYDICKQAEVLRNSILILRFIEYWQLNMNSLSIFSFLIQCFGADYILFKVSCCRYTYILLYDFAYNVFYSTLFPFTETWWSNCAAWWGLVGKCYLHLE